MANLDRAQLSRRVARLERIMAVINQAYATGSVPKPLSAEDVEWIKGQNTVNGRTSISTDYPTP